MALIRELLNDKDTMSRLNDNERQTLMQLSQCHHEDFASPRKRFVGLIYWLLWLPFFNLSCPNVIIHSLAFNNNPCLIAQGK